MEVSRGKFFPTILSLFIILVFLFSVRDTGSSKVNHETNQATLVYVKESRFDSKTSAVDAMKSDIEGGEEKWEKITKRETFANRPVRNTILVDKAGRKLYVARRQAKDYKILYEFPVSVGQIRGNKVERGDKRTPEGIYKVIDVKFDRELPAKYGPMAFVLSYPNDRDRLLGKSGSGIWLHGTGQRILTPDTEGCVELTDKGIVELSAFLSYKTPIFIFPERRPLTKNKNWIPASVIDGLEMEYTRELPMLRARMRTKRKG